MPAALLMSNVQAAVKAVASDDMPPPQVCSRVNRVLHGNLAAGNFVTDKFGSDLRWNVCSERFAGVLLGQGITK